MPIRRIAKLVRARLRPRRHRPAILMYHRVAILHRDIWDLAVSPENFDEQVAYIRKHRSPMSMDDLVQRLRSGTLPADAIALTFDDGYRDNLVNAQPILVRHNVPATVFVATGYTNQTTTFWWDELASMILDSTSPVDLRQECGSDSVALSWGAQEDADHDPAWRGWDPPRSQRQKAYVALWQRLQSAEQAQRARILGSLRAQLPSPPDPLGVPMSTAEFDLLTADGLISLGAHTVTHPALTDLDSAERRRQIRQSGEQCRALTTKPVKGFCYPYGNFDADVRNDVEAEAFCWACTTEIRFLDDGRQDLLTLPRLTVLNVGAQKFADLITG